MNPADRLELDDLRREQLHVRNLVGQLDRRIEQLVSRQEEPAPSVVPPPLPKPADLGGTRSRATLASPEPPAAELSVGRAEARPSESVPTAVSAEPLELRVGTYWMSRVGIVILLTGLVFLGNYAYHRIIPLLGAWGKLSLLALAGVALGGLGAWLARSRESTRNFGRVLLAGGAATIYYTAYAAHFVSALRVIESPIVGGVLLLALTGAFVFYADRRKSEAVAVPAVLLAYFTSSINAIGEFTLFSNLLLTAVAVFFLARHRWQRLSFLSLAATYGSYVMWKLGHLLHVGGVYGEFGAGIIFLSLYWVLFTCAVFLAAPSAMRAATRIAFLTLNNGAFFALAASHFTSARYGSFWIFALIFGGVLLALAALAFRLRTEERVLDGSYLAQGIALVTVGIAAKLTGPQLAVVLAVESAVLLVAARARHRTLLEIAAALCALAACGLTIQTLDEGEMSPLALALPVVALLLFDTWRVKRSHADRAGFSSRAAGFAVLALATLGALVWQICPDPWRSTAFASVATVSLFALLVRLPEVTAPAQLFTPLAIALFCRALLLENGSRWSALAPVLTVAMTGWAAGVAAGGRTFGGIRVSAISRLYRFAALGMLGAWAFVFVEPTWRVAFYAAGGAALVIVGAFTANPERRTSGAVYGAAALAFFWARPGSAITWVELLAILAIPASLRLGQRLCAETPLLPSGRDALVGAAMASLWLWVTRWMFHHGHGSQLTIAWALLALLIFAAGLALRERIYRLGGFGVLALAIGRLFVIDVWRFDTLPRIASFLVLGVVLLVLSFVYNRFAEALRRWL